MKDVLDHCNELFSTLKIRVEHYNTRLKALEARSANLDVIAKRQKEKDTELAGREAKIIPSERLIKREQDCDKKMDEVNQGKASVLQMSKNANAVVSQENEKIASEKRGLAVREKELKENIFAHGEEKKNFKAKVIASIEGT